MDHDRFFNLPFFSVFAHLSELSLTESPTQLDFPTEAYYSYLTVGFLHCSCCKVMPQIVMTGVRKACKIKPFFRYLDYLVINKQIVVTMTT